MDRGTENSRGVHALMLLDGVSGLSMEGLRGIAYDSYLPAFEEVVPAVVEAYDAAPASSSHKAELAGPVDSLRAWDLRWGVESVPTALAVFYGTELVSALRANARAAQMSVYDYMSSRATDQELLEGLSAAVDRLEEDFGTWLTPWGQINRFQRLTGDIVQDFDDDAPSTPVGFTSSRWGSLASFGARPYPGTNRWYGTSGNSFVAVVEFGDSLRAIAVTAGGLSNDPTSPHFNDQAERYATGNLREVYFYPEDIQANAEREYHPGG
jgi:acyl-homoserine-lactone acylase